MAPLAAESLRPPEFHPKAEVRSAKQGEQRFKVNSGKFEYNEDVGPDRLVNIDGKRSQISFFKEKAKTRKKAAKVRSTAKGGPPGLNQVESLPHNIYNENCFKSIGKLGV